MVAVNESSVLNHAQSIVAKMLFDSLVNPKVNVFFTTCRSGKTWLFQNLEAFMSTPEPKTYPHFVKWLHNKMQEKVKENEGETTPAS